MLPSWWEGGPNITWPPEPWKQVYRRYEEHGAWFAGDPSLLVTVYRGVPASQGVWRTNFDRFWASGIAAPQQRRMLHAPLASDIAATSSDLLFSEPPDFNCADGQERLDELIDELQIVQTMSEAAEGVSALGGGFLRVTWNKEFESDHPILDAVYADSALPEWQWGILQAVSFWFQVSNPEQDTVYRKIERHEKGRVLHRLYRGTGGQLGDVVPLATLAEFAALEDVVETGYDGLTAVYVPNMRPNRVFRGMPLGRSDYDGVEGMMDALDEVWTSWMRDLRLARARLIVSQELVESKGKGQGSKLDLDQEVWESLPFSSQNVDKMITPSQFAIRTAEHTATADALVSRIVSAAGYAAATFGLHAEQIRGATATEVINRERRSFITRSKKINYFDRPAEKILQALLAVDAAQFGQAGGTFDVELKWPDALQQDWKETSVIAQALRVAKAASTETLVRMLHNDWDDSQVAAEVKKINDDNLSAGPPPPNFPANPREGSPDPGIPAGTTKGPGMPTEGPPSLGPT